MQQRWSPYLLAIASITAVTVLNFVSTLVEVPFLLYFGVVIICSAKGGRAAGLLSAILSALVVDYCFLTPYSLLINAPKQNFWLGLFLCEALLIGWGVSELQRSRQEYSLSVFELQLAQTRQQKLSTYLKHQVAALRLTQRKYAALSAALERKIEERTTELRSQNLELLRLGELKDEFLSTISHDLRLPLTNARMAIELLKLTDNLEQRERSLRILESENSRSIDLVNDLLDLQRLSVGAEVVNPILIPLKYWIPHVLEPFEMRAKDRAIALSLEILLELPELETDAEHLKRVLSELVHNAVKYTPPGEKIIVSAQAFNKFIQISVTNTGVEIPADKLPQIFEKFYRVPGGDKFKQGGTGLGLAIAKGLVELMGGTIKATSRNGEVRFALKLPLG